MSHHVFLSHALDVDTPGYGGSQGFSKRVLSAIKDNASSNSTEMTLTSHVGTHVDAPFHFSDQGDTTDQFPADFWVCSRPCLVDLPTDAGALIDAGAWCDAVPTDCDLLLIKTGFENLRADPVYWSANPGLTPALGRFFRTHRPALKMVGFDFLSLTSYCHRPIGREAHRAFLAPAPDCGRALVIIEDMKLSPLIESPREVIVAPLRIRGGDGGPATVIAKVAS